MPDKQIVIIAGPNGAGKTTFVDQFLPSLFETPLFVNADKIASGLAPFSPESEAIQAGKLMLKQIDKYVTEGLSFSLETTLSGKGYLRKIPKWRNQGYIVALVFLSLDNEQAAIDRVAYRVSQGGHDIPVDVIKRRFHNGLKNFTEYKNLVDKWYFFKNKGKRSQLIDSGGN